MEAGCLSVSACVRICALWSYFLYYVLSISPPPSPSSFTPFFLFEEQAPPLSFWFLFSSSSVFLFLWFLLSLSQSGCQDRRRTTGCCISSFLAHAFSSFPSSSFYRSVPFFPAWSSLSVAYMRSLSISTQPAICSPSDLFSSSPLPPSLPTFSLCEELLLKWCSLLCLELCCLSHPFNYQDHPLFLFFLLSSSFPSFFLCAHPCIAGSQSGSRVCHRILDTRVVEAGP